MDAIISLIVFLVVGGIILALYLCPSIVAYYRKKTNLSSILVLNIFLGWSLIGWVVSLVWALAKDEVKATT